MTALVVEADGGSRGNPGVAAGGAVVIDPQTGELLTELGCDHRIATKGIPAPIQASTRWVVERTNSWHNRGFKKLLICTEKRIRVIDAFIALANAIITVRRLIREGWTRYRWDGRPNRRP